MKKFLPLLILLGLFGNTLSAADAKTELQELIGKVKTKLEAGKRTEQDLAEELNGFDALLAAHKEEKTEEVSQILVMKGILYMQVLGRDDKAIETFQQLKADFPATKAGMRADELIASIAKQKEAKKIQSGLVEGTQFPDFEQKDLDGKPLSITRFKGKIVMIDFWATWCGPCVGELPNVIKAYEKYHSQGFEIIGISLDKEKEKLTSFIKEQKMPWPQYFDGKMWKNDLATKYGINSIPATYLLDKEGKIIAKGLRGEALDAAIAKAVGAK